MGEPPAAVQQHAKHDMRTRVTLEVLLQIIIFVISMTSCSGGRHMTNFKKYFKKAIMYQRAVKKHMFNCSMIKHLG